MKKYVITEELLTDIELRLGAYYGSEIIRGRPLKVELKKERKKVLDLLQDIDEFACPHVTCRSCDGHNGLNCRDCLIAWLMSKL